MKLITSYRPAGPFLRLRSANGERCPKQDSCPCKIEVMLLFRDTSASGNYGLFRCHALASFLHLDMDCWVYVFSTWINSTSGYRSCCELPYIELDLKINLTLRRWNRLDHRALFADGNSKTQFVIAVIGMSRNEHADTAIIHIQALCIAVGHSGVIWHLSNPLGRYDRSFPLGERAALLTLQTVVVLAGESEGILSL